MVPTGYAARTEGMHEMGRWAHKMHMPTLATRTAARIRCRSANHQSTLSSACGRANTGLTGANVATGKKWASSASQPGTASDTERPRTSPSTNAPSRKQVAFPGAPRTMGGDSRIADSQAEQGAQDEVQQRQDGIAPPAADESTADKAMHVAVALAEFQDVATTSTPGQQSIYDLYSPRRRSLILFAVATASVIVPFTDTIYLPALEVRACMHTAHSAVCRVAGSSVLRCQRPTLTFPGLRFFTHTLAANPRRPEHKSGVGGRQCGHLHGGGWHCSAPVGTNG